jgi:hypothetical protein
MLGLLPLALRQYWLSKQAQPLSRMHRLLLQSLGLVICNSNHHSHYFNVNYANVLVLVLVLIFVLDTLFRSKLPVHGTTIAVATLESRAKSTTPSNSCITNACITCRATTTTTTTSNELVVQLYQQPTTASADRREEESVLLLVICAPTVVFVDR